MWQHIMDSYQLFNGCSNHIVVGNKHQTILSVASLVGSIIFVRLPCTTQPSEEI